MKLSVSTYSLSLWRKEQNKTLENSIDAIADLGVRAIEFANLDSSKYRGEKLRRRAEKHGLRVVNYCTWSEMLLPPDRLRKEIERVKREVDFAAALGARTMRHDVTRDFGDWADQAHVKRTFASALNIVVPAIREIADYGKSMGVRTSMENHGYFLQHSTRVQKLLKAVDHPNFGYTMDMGNFMFVNEDPVAAVRRMTKYPQFVHVKDFHRRPIKDLPLPGWSSTPTPYGLRGAVCGHGVIDVKKQVSLLKQAGYKGYLSLEFEGIEDSIKAVRMGLEFLRGLGLK